jgi:DNA recombination protein RmuC
MAVVAALLLLALLASLFFLVRKNKRLAEQQTTLGELSSRLASRETELQMTQQRSSLLEGQLEQQLQTTQQLREQQARLESNLHAERQNHHEKMQLLLQAREQMTLEFRQLAGDILEHKGKLFREASQQQLTQLLQPLGERLQQFEKKVDDTYDKEAKQRFSLEKEIKALMELNTRISDDATNLTNALRGESKTQGTWGEVILERVLEKSGLQKGREYEVQVSLKDEEGKKGQPDVIVHLPEKKDVVIDSKVSLTAYQAYFGSGDDEERALRLKQHIASIRGHIKNLASKNYHNLLGINSPDYVLMFLPVEAAFTLAVQHDDTLFMEAFELNIILVGPSTLLATLRTIHNIWRYEYQSKNVAEIAKQAGLLYDKFVAFAQDIDKIGERLHQTQDAWDAAHNKLRSGRGNLFSKVEKLKILGARTSKSLPEQLPDHPDEAGGDDDE